MVGAMLAEMSAGNEGSLFFDAAQRAAVLRGLFEKYYHAIHPARTVFDTSRGWTTRWICWAGCSRTPRVICCVRPIPWIIDSVERLLRRTHSNCPRSSASSRAAPSFDARLGTPGLHAVRSQVQATERRTILPPDLWERFERTSIWRMPDFDTRGVSVACEPSALRP